MSGDVLNVAVEALERVPVPVRWSDVEDRLDRADRAGRPGWLDADDADDLGSTTWARSRSRHRRLLVVAAGVVTAGLVAAVVVVGTGDDPGPVSTGPGPTTSTSSDSTTTTAPATRTSRTFPVTAVAGDEYLVWGGEAGENDVSARADGFAVDLAGGAVRPIPAAPIDPRTGATGVWTGSELIVCCGVGQQDGFAADTRSAAAWDPGTGQWRTLARPPAGVARSFPASVWTGEVMVVMATGPAVAVYDPAADRWTEVATPPAIDRHPGAVWTGDEVILWDARIWAGPLPAPAGGEGADRGWRWAPGRDSWTPLPALPTGSRTQLGSLAWTGTEAVVWGDSMDAPGLGVGATWRPGDDRWRPIGPSPQAAFDAYEGTAGSQTVVVDPDRRRILVRALETDGVEVPPLLVYDVATETWTVSDLAVPGYHPPLTVAGGRLLVPDSAAPVVAPVPP
jgi:hypothetical protein